MSDAVEPVAKVGEQRTFTATSLGALIGFDRRTVNLWAEQGCPCGEMTGKGGKRRTFSTVEVAAWLRSTGRVVPPALEGLCSGGGGGGGGKAGGDARPTDASAADGGPTRSVGVPNAGGAVDYGEMIRSAQDSLSTMLKKMPASEDIGAVAKYCGAIKDLISELRALDKDRDAADKRAERIVDVAEAGQMLEGLAQDFVYGLDSIVESGGGTMLAALDGAGVVVPPEQRDGAQRSLQDGLRRLVMTLRGRMVDVVGGGAK